MTYEVIEERDDARQKNAIPTTKGPKCSAGAARDQQTMGKTLKTFQSWKGGGKKRKQGQR